MKKFLWLFFALFIARPVCSQSTTLTGQVTDSGSQNWNNGTITAVFVVNPAYPAQPQYIWTGGTLNSQISGTLSGTGSYSLSIPSNSAITPVNSQWRFQVCSQASSPCFYTPPLTITGATQTLNITPPIILINLLVATPPVAAYADSELTGAKFGSRYYNVTSQTERVCQVVSGNNCLTWVDVGAGSASAAGSPPQTQVNDPGNPGHFGGTPCENFPSLTVGPINADCDWHAKGPNPWFDITRYGARGLNTQQTTTATCTASSQSVTLANAIDFINGDGIVLHACGAATTLTTPTAPTVVPKGILNGSTTRAYKIIAEDFNLGLTAASAATTTTTSAATLGSNSVSITSAVLSGGVVTVTTTANHNFQIGEKVGISGTSCPTVPNPSNGNVLNAVLTIQTIPSGTTFTGLIPVDKIFACTVSSGIAAVFAHVWVNWNLQANALRYWIYRQDGGVGAFNLVGVAQGAEPFYDDGFPAPSTVNLPEVPSTAPASATNQSIATTITAGAGTTSITVANAATVNASGVSAQHDNSLAYLAAFNAANANSGSVYVPGTGALSLGFVFNFPLVLPRPSNGQIDNKIFGQMTFNQPLIPQGNMRFVAESPGTVGVPAFARSTFGGPFSGPGYPTVFLPGSATVFFDNIAITTPGNPHPNQNWQVLAENGVEINFIRDAITITSSDSGAVPVVLRGGSGFNYVFKDTLLTASANTGNYFNSPALWIRAGSASPSGWPGIGLTTRTSFLGGGIVFDADATGGVVTNAGSPWEFNNSFSENICGPFIYGRNINTSGWGSVSVTGSANSLADNACGSSPALVDFSSPNVTGPVSLTSSDLILPGSTNTVQLTASSGGANYSIPHGHVNLNATGSMNNGSGRVFNPGNTIETDTAIRVADPGVYVLTGNPPTGASSVLSAGGSVPIGTWSYVVTALDQNGGETSTSTPGNAITTTTGNQTITTSWTAPSDFSPASYNLYRSNGGGYGLVANVTGLSFIDSAATILGNVSSALSVGGPSGISQPSGVWTNNLRLTAGKFKEDISAPALTANVSGIAIIGGYQNSSYDNFNRANGAIGSNWTVNSGGFNVSSNVIVGTAGTDVAFWTATPYSNKQFAQLTLVSAPNGGQGPEVFVQSSGDSGYNCIETAASIIIQRRNPLANLTSAVITGVAGDLIRLEATVSGSTTTLNCFRNGAATPTLTTTDATYTSGAPGMFSGDNTSTMDNWSGGNLHPIAQLDTEQDWTQPQHFTQPVTIGATNPIAGTLAAGLYSPRYTITGGAAPTCAVTGAGTGATCTLSSFSTDNSGAMQINSGTTPGANGTWTLTFSTGFPNAAFCTVGPGSGGTTLNARATVFDNTNGTLGVHAGVWDNNGIAINASQAITFIISYNCGGH